MIPFIPDKTVFPHDVIEGIKEALEDKVEFAMLFGSAVTGRMTLESDHRYREYSDSGQRVETSGKL